MSIISVCVLGVFAVLSALTLKNYNKEIAAMIILSAVVLLGIAVLPLLSELCVSVKEFSALANIPGEYVSVLVKSLGMCYITQISVDLCKENGSQSVASQIEIAGKVLILVIAIPVYNDIIEMITGFLQ